MYVGKKFYFPKSVYLFRTSVTNELFSYPKDRRLMKIILMNTLIIALLILIAS